MVTDSMHGVQKDDAGFAQRELKPCWLGLVGLVPNNSCAAEDRSPVKTLVSALTIVYSVKRSWTDAEREDIYIYIYISLKTATKPNWPDDDTLKNIRFFEPTHQGVGLVAGFLEMGLQTKK